MNNKVIQAFILAGGKSSRMGTEKGLAILNEKKLIDYLIATLTAAGLKINISSNTHLYDVFGFPVYEDIIKEKGPMGGIYTALTHTQSDAILILSCDIPFINKELITHLISYLPLEGDCLVPTQQNNSEPLCAIYSKKCAHTFLDLLNKNELSIRKSLEVLNTKFIKIDDLSFYKSNLLMNLNSKDEIYKAQHLISN